MLDKIAQPGALSIKARLLFLAFVLALSVLASSFLTFPDYLVVDLIIVKKRISFEEKGFDFVASR